MKGKMKKSSKYLISAVLIVVALISIYGIATTITKALAEDTKVEINAKLDKYINYEVYGNERGTLVQYNVGTGVLSEKSEIGEIENNEITIELSKIDQKYPERVTVVSKDKEEKDDYSYTYDIKSGKIVINTKKINNFDVLCYYGTYTEKEEERDVSIKLSAKVKVDKNEKEISGVKELEEKVTKNQGDYISASHKTEEIYNGNIKSNIINGTEYDTEYKEKLQILISKKELEEKLQITEKDSYIEEPENDLGNNNELLIKSTKLKKDDIIEIFGEEGVIQILDENDEVLAEINKDTTYDENGTYEIKYEKEIRQLKIKTSEIKGEARILNVENTKLIKNTMKNINAKIKTTDEIKATSLDESEKYTFNSSKITEIKDTKSDVKFEIDNKNWTSEKQNEVLFTVELDSSSIDKNLFKTPSLRIELPDDVAKVVVGNVSLLYGNGLELGEVEEIEENGKKIINVKLNGEQKEHTEYAFDSKARINIPVTIILKQGIELGKEETVTLKYTNNYTVNGIAEEGIVETKITEYDGNKKINENNNNANIDTSKEENSSKDDVQGKTIINVEAKRGDEKLSKDSIAYEGEFIKYTVTVTNPTQERIDNVKATATIPEGLTYAEYKDNYTDVLVESKHEYDENIRQKEFILGTLTAGETKKIEYEVRVNDLGENETEKTTNTVVETVINNEVDSRIKFTNKIATAEYKVYLSALRANTLNSYSYKLKVISNNEENVNVVLKYPQGFVPKFYVYIPSEEDIEQKYNQVKDNLGQDGVDPDKVKSYFDGDTNTEQINYFEESDINNNEITLSSIKTNAEYGIHFDVDNSLLEEGINGKVNLSATAIVNGKYKSNEHIINYSKENVVISMSSPTEGEEVSYGDIIEYRMKLKMDSKLLQDKDEEAYAVVNLKDYLPEEVEPISITYPKNTTQTLEDTNNLRDEITFKDEDGNPSEISTETLNKVVGKIVFKEGEVVTENLNKTLYKDENGNPLPNIDKKIVLPYNKDVEVIVKTKAKHVYEKTRVTNTAISESKNIQYKIDGEDNITKIDVPAIVKVSNIVTHTILPYGYEEAGINEQNTQNNQNVINRTDGQNQGSKTNTETEGTKHYVSGTVWNDSNENASRQNTEKTIENVEVMLVDAKTGNVVNNVKTNSNGTYKFTNVESGSYLVIFKYDANKYHPTEYQKKEVNSNANSDAMQREINIEGQDTTVAITDIIELNQDKEAIDLGLVENKIFDLKVDKYISKVTVNTVNGTRQSEYDNVKLAKAEIRAKEMQGATVVVEYKIVVTNEGEIPARVNKIVDYLPQGLNFSSELNSSWAKDTNGNIINTSISTQEIKPGQSVELKLIATKVMTGESTGTFTNSVELSDVTNAYNIKDKDSTPANKAEGEDDLSKADLIISVSTGAIVYISTGIVLGVLLIALIVFLNMKYNIFSKIVKKKAMLVVMIGAMILALGANYSDAYSLTSNLGYGYGTTKAFYVYGWPHTGVNGGPAYLSGNGRYLSCIWPSVIDYSLNTGNYVYRSLGSISSIGDTVRQETGNIDLSGITADEETRLHLKENDTNYILGPMTITNTRDTEGYVFELLDSNGNRIDGFATCDENGNALEVKGTSTFYITVPQANCVNGISKVRARARRSGTITITETFTAYEEWYGGQAMGGYSTNHEWTETREEYVEGELVFEWIPLGSLEIIKIDSRSTGVKLPDVEFRITSDNGFDQTVKTDKDGRIYLTDLETGEYKVTEVSNPNYGYEVTADNIFNIKVLSGITNRYTLKNEKAYIDLSGMVWKDKKPNTKENQAIDGIYEEGIDELISNIEDKVIAKLVYKDSGEIVKNQEGKECIAEVVDGKYRFEKIRVKELSSYNVIFTYNGFEYQNVNIDPEPVLEDTSKASENDTYRKLYNERFSIVEGTGEKTGITFGGDAQGLGGHDLEYERNKENSYVSNLIKIDGGFITGRDYNYKIEMNASTNDNYINSRYMELLKDQNKVVDEITYINLGVYERAMPDLELEQLLHNTRLTINGYEHTYFYNNKGTNNEQYTGGFNVGVKFPRVTEGYRSAIYKSDWDTFNEVGKTNKLQMYLTYSIEINNQSTGLDAQVHSIIDYFDSRYTINKVGTTVNKNTGEISGDNIKAEVDNSYSQNGYKKAIITLSGDNIEPNKGTIVFIEFKLNDDATLSEITGEGALKNVAEINSYSIYDGNGIYAGIDINSNPANAVPGDRTTYENDTAHALDVRLETKKQERRVSGIVFEDMADEKTRKEKNIIEGNGILDDTEKKIQGVTVELVNNKTGEVVKTTTTDENGKFELEGFIPGEYVVRYTWGKEKGGYDVNNYKATIFNEEAHKVEDGWWTKGNPDSDAKDNYLTRLKIDDGEQENGEFIKEMTSTSAIMNLGIENGNSWVDKETSETSKDYSLLYTISNNDELIPESMEISGVNFGIIIRPEIKLTTEKRVSHFKITYQNGQVLTDVDIEYDEETNTYKTTGTKNGMSYLPVDTINPYGIIRQEMDPELIQGSTMEVTYEIVVKNDSNVDYANINFYTYGIASEDTTNPVTITPTVVTDYLDSEFEFNQAKNPDWKVVSSYNNESFNPVVTTKTEVAGDWKLVGEENATGALGGYTIERYSRFLGRGERTEIGTTKEYSFRAQRTVEDPAVQEQYKNVRIELSEDKIKEIKPGERITSNLYIEKRLSNEDDITFDNEVEVTEYEEKSGRVPYAKNIGITGWAERIEITPATGGNRNFIIPVTIGIGMLAILGTGVLVIKKRVLDK